MYREPDICPHCGLSKNVRVVRSGRNILRVLRDAGVFAICLPFWLLGLWWPEPKGLLRLCEECGLYFDRRRTWKKVVECPVCHYSLKGNTSGRCPECGWKLPRWFVGRADQVPMRDERNES